MESNYSSIETTKSFSSAFDFPFSASWRAISSGKVCYTVSLQNSHMSRSHMSRSDKTALQNRHSDFLYIIHRQTFLLFDLDAGFKLQCERLELSRLFSCELLAQDWGPHRAHFMAVILYAVPVVLVVQVLVCSDILFCSGRFLAYLWIAWLIWFFLLVFHGHGTGWSLGYHCF